MRKFKIEVNTDGRYDAIWNIDILPDYHEMEGENLTAEDVIYDVAQTWWINMDSEEYEALAQEGIEDYKDMIKAYAWRVFEVTTNEDGYAEHTEIGTV